MPDPAASLIEHFPWRILQAVAAAYVPDGSYIVSVRPPVCPLDLVYDLTRRTARKRRSRQRSHADPRTNRMVVQQDSHFAARRDRHELGAAHAQGAGFRTLWAGSKHFHRISLPGGAVQNGLPIRSKS